jgi:hypothetical protein
MKEFLTAVLVDNDHQQRMMGLQDSDIAEIYEQSVEIMTLNEEVSCPTYSLAQLGKKISFHELC